MCYSLISMSYLGYILWMVYHMALQIYKRVWDSLLNFREMIHTYSINFVDHFYNFLYINKTKLLRIVNMFVFPSKPKHPLPTTQPEPTPLNMRVNILGYFGQQTCPSWVTCPTLLTERNVDGNLKNLY